MSSCRAWQPSRRCPGWRRRGLSGSRRQRRGRWERGQLLLPTGARRKRVGAPRGGSMCGLQSQLRYTKRRGVHRYFGDRRREWCGLWRNCPPTRCWVGCAGALSRCRLGSGTREPPSACPVSYCRTAERRGPWCARRSASGCRSRLWESGAIRSERLEARRLWRARWARPPGWQECTGPSAGVFARSSSSEYISA